MAKRELSKCRVWEQERRDRLKNCFTALGKLLPCYEPSSSLSKIEILQKAASIISELQNKNKDLLLGGTESTQAQREEIRKLQERIKKLLTRNEQLANLLQTAGIRVPSECGTVKSFNHNKKWSSKITPDIADNIVKRLSKNASYIKPTTEAIQKKKQKISTVPRRKKKIVTTNENIDLNNKVGSQKKNLSLHKKKSSKSSSLPLNKPIFAPSLGPGTLILADGRVLPIGQPSIPRPLPQTTLATSIVHPPITRRSLPTSLTTPTMTRPLAPPILTTPSLARPQVTPTTVILMQRPRPVVCKPGIGAKVPIPALRKQTAPVVCDSKNAKKEDVKKKKDLKKGSKENKPVLKTKMVQKCTKSISTKVSTIAQLEKTVKKIDGGQNNHIISKETKTDSQKAIEIVENMTENQDISSQNTENKSTLESVPKIVQKIDKNVEYSTLNVGQTEPQNNDLKMSDLSSKNSSNTDDTHKNHPTPSENVTESTKTLKEKVDLTAKTDISEKVTDISDGNKIESETNKVSETNYPCSKYNFENNINVDIEKNLSKNNIKNSDGPVNNVEASKSNFGDQSLKTDFETSGLSKTYVSKSVSDMQLNKITSIPKEIFTNPVLQPISNYNFGSGIHPESDKEISKNNTNFDQMNFENSSIQCKKNISENHSDITKYSFDHPKVNSEITNIANHTELTKYTFTESNISPNSKTDTEVANISEHHSELSNDIFATLSGPSNSGAHPESMSPTAAFLLAFPLVSTLTGNGTTSGAPKNGTEVTNEDNSDSRQDTPTLLQIGTIETSGTISNSVNIKVNSDSTNLIALDNFSTFFGQNTGFEEKKKDPKTLSETGYQTKKIDSVKQNLNSYQCNTFNPFSDNPTEKYNLYPNCGYDYNFLPESSCSKNTPKSTFGYEEKRNDKRTSNRAPVNWMTTPDIRHQTGDLSSLPPFEFGAIFGNNHNWDNNYKTEEENNRWSWSPGKLLPPLIGQSDHGNVSTLSITNTEIAESTPISKTYEGTYSSSHLEYLNVSKTMDNSSKIIHLEQQPTTNVSKNTTAKVDASIGHVDYPNIPKPMETNPKMFHLEQKTTATKINAPNGHFECQNVSKSIENNSKNSTKVDTIVSKPTDNSKMFHLELQTSSISKNNQALKMDATIGHIDYQNVPKTIENKSIHLNSQNSSNVPKSATVRHLEYPNISKSMENSNKIFHSEHQYSTKAIPTSKMSSYTNTSMENTPKMFHLEPNNSEVSKTIKADGIIGKVQQNSGVSKMTNASSKISDPQLKIFHSEPKTISTDMKSLQTVTFLEHGKVSHSIDSKTFMDSQILSTTHLHGISSVSKNSEHKHVTYPTNVQLKSRPLEHGNKNAPKMQFAHRSEEMVSKPPDIKYTYSNASSTQSISYSNNYLVGNISAPKNSSELKLNPFGNQENINTSMPNMTISTSLTENIKNTLPKDSSKNYSGHNQVSFSVAQQIEHVNTPKDSKRTNIQTQHQKIGYSEQQTQRKATENLRYTENAPKIYPNQMEQGLEYHTKNSAVVSNFGSKVEHIAPKLYPNLLDQNLEQKSTNFVSKTDNGALKMFPNQLGHSMEHNTNKISTISSNFGTTTDSIALKMYPNQLEQNLEHNHNKNSTISTNFGSKTDSVGLKLYPNQLEHSLEHNQNKNSPITSNFGSKTDGAALKMYPNQLDHSLDKNNTTSSNFGSKVANSALKMYPNQLDQNKNSPLASVAPKIYPNQLEQNKNPLTSNCGPKLYPNKLNQTLEHHQPKNNTNFGPKVENCIQNATLTPNFTPKCDSKVYPTQNPLEIATFEHQKNTTSNFGQKMAPKLYPNQLDQNLDQHRTKNSTITSNFRGNTYQYQMEYPKRSEHPNLAKMWENGTPENNILSKNYIGYQDYTPKSTEYSGYSKHFPIITHSDMVAMSQSNVSVTYSTGLAPISTNIPPFVNLENRNTVVSSNLPYRHGENRNVSDNISIPSSIASLGHGDHGNLYPIGNISVPTTLPSIGDHGSVPVPTTLPTLVGDLALGTVAPNLEENRRNPVRENSRRKSVQNNPIEQNYDMQNTTFSVSHLVEHQKEENRNQATKRTHNAAKASVPNRQNSHKRKTECYRQNQKWSESKRFKNSNSTNYSAEALIGDSRYQQQSSHQQFANFHGENQASANQQSGVYFQQQESYPAFGTYPTGFYGDDFQNSDKEPRKMAQCQTKKHTARTKGRQATTEIIPPYVDLSFLSMPTAISSPLLTEGAEFNAPGGGANPFPAPPSAPLYYGRHYGPNSPTTNIGGQLTSFNLSAIFPEIGGKASYSSSGKNSTQQTTSSGSYVPSSFANT